MLGFSDSRVCLWNGGNRWGFGHGGPAQAIPLDRPHALLRHVVPSQYPGSDDGHRVVTDVLHIGAGSACSAMSPAPATGVPSQRVRD